MFSQYGVGCRLDILDKSDVFCPAIVINNNVSSILVHYIGWDSAWDEIVTDASRIGNSTRFVKAWVRLARDMCWWPSVLYLRVPKEGSKVGDDYLRTENRMLVFPCAVANKHGLLRKFWKPDGVWVNACDVSPFGFKLDAKRIKIGQNSNLKSFFAAALLELEEDSKSVQYEFRLDGTLDVAVTLQHAQKQQQVEAKKEILPLQEPKAQRGVIVSFPMSNQHAGNNKSANENHYKRFYTFDDNKKILSGITDVPSTGRKSLESVRNIHSTRYQQTADPNLPWPSVVAVNAVVSLLGHLPEVPSTTTSSLSSSSSTTVTSSASIVASKSMSLPSAAEMRPVQVQPAVVSQESSNICIHDLHSSLGNLDSINLEKFQWDVHAFLSSKPQTLMQKSVTSQSSCNVTNSPTPLVMPNSSSLTPSIDVGRSRKHPLNVSSLTTTETNPSSSLINVSPESKRKRSETGNESWRWMHVRPLMKRKKSL